ncbi:MAG: gliding motility protein GldL [Bacteroidota bacterium]
MSFLKSKGFKYLKNLLIGVGAACVMVGALFKIESLPYASEFLTAGLLTEAFIFLFLGLIGPEKDYYWEKLYPGLDKYGGTVEGWEPQGANMDINTEKMEGQLDGMLTELRTMSSSLSSLQALQEVDFTGTSEQIKKLGDFYSNLNEAMANINDSIDDTRMYKEQLGALNQNLSSLNSVYGNILTTMANPLGGK